MIRQPDTIEADGGVKVYHLGPPQDQGPMPTLIYLSIAGDESLLLDPFNQPVTALQDLPMRIFSFDLPGHGADFDKNHAIRWLSQEVREGRDPFNPFFVQATETIGYLIRQGWIDPQKIAMAGLSRGVFFAMHIAARLPEVKTLLGFAPMTFLSYQKDFADLQDHPLIQQLSPLNLIEKLYTRSFRFYIGNHDIAVGTERCFTLLQALTDHAFANYKRSPEIEMIMSPSIGHRGHGTSAKIFLEGAAWIKEKLLS